MVEGAINVSTNLQGIHYKLNLDIGDHERVRLTVATDFECVWRVVGYIHPPLWLTVCDSVELLDNYRTHNLTIPQMKFQLSSNCSRSSKEPNEIVDIKLTMWSHPAKFGFLNIHSAKNFNICSGIGDLYAWNISDWEIDNRVDRAIHNQLLFFEELCGGRTMLKIKSSFVNARLFLRKFGGEEIIDIQAGENRNYVPYLSTVDNMYVNIYTNAGFNGTWCENQPNSDDEHCIVCGGDLGKCCNDGNCAEEADIYFKVNASRSLSLRYLKLL